jgi:hypothetical protein
LAESGATADVLNFDVDTEPAPSFAFFTAPLAILLLVTAPFRIDFVATEFLAAVDAA